MEVFYTNCDQSLEGELSLEGEKHIPGTRGLHIPRSQGKGVLICCAILNIGFVLFIVLLSLSLKNDSDISTHINLMSAHFSQRLLNVSKEVSDSSLKIKLIQAECRKELLQKAAAKGNLTSVVEELTEVKRENRKIAKDVVQVLEGLNNLTGALMANGNLTSELEKLAELTRENGRLVLEGLNELKRGNGRIARDVTLVQEELHNLTGFFCLNCPENWRNFERNCYFFSTLRRSWTSAKRSCEAEEAQLVIINNRAEQNFLARQMLSNQVAWIGLSDTVAEGKWVWVDGTPLSLSFWGSGEPNNAGQIGEDCATLKPEGTWNDAHCSNNDFWICERKC